jgi:hypothetical protein
MCAPGPVTTVLRPRSLRETDLWDASHPLLMEQKWSKAPAPPDSDGDNFKVHYSLKAPPRNAV